MSAKKYCCWVIQPAKLGTSAIYCNRATNYKIQRDDDGNRVRVYDSFCPEHMAANERNPPTDEDIDL